MTPRLRPALRAAAGALALAFATHPLRAQGAILPLDDVGYT